MANEQPTPSLRSQARPWEKAETDRSLLQLVTTSALFASSWALCAWTVTQGQWALYLVMVVVTGGLAVRLFIFQHDCGHGSFFKTRRQNNLVGNVLSVFTLAPYAYWQKTHDIHHAVWNNLDRRNDLGYLWLLTVDEYRAASPLVRFGYRIYRNPLALFLLGVPFQFIVKHRLPWDTPSSWRREWASVAICNLGIGGVIAVAHATIGLKMLLIVHLPVAIIECVLGGWAFFLQHNFEGAYYARDGEWNHERASLQGSSWLDLPPLLAWVTGDIGLHHIHHLAPGIPNYKLVACLEAVPALAAVPRLTLRESFSNLRYSLYDESSHRMIALGEFARMAPTQSSPNHEQPDWANLKTVFTQRCNELGLLHIRPQRYVVPTVIALVVTLSAWTGLLMAQSLPIRIACLAVSALMVIRWGLFAHDIGHYNLSKKPRTTELLGQVVMTTIAGVSFTLWQLEHNGHHAHTGHALDDPDFQTGFFVFAPEQQPTTALQHFVARASAHPHLASRAGSSTQHTREELDSRLRTSWPLGRPGRAHHPGRVLAWHSRLAHRAARCGSELHRDDNDGLPPCCSAASSGITSACAPSPPTSRFHTFSNSSSAAGTSRTILSTTGFSAD